MRSRLNVMALSFVAVGLATAPSFAASDPNDAQGTKDPALFTRMPGYHIYRAEDIPFDRYEVKTSASKTQVIEGHHVVVYYDPNAGIQAPSPVQIGRNYGNAIKAIGGQVVYEYSDPGANVVLKASKGGVETWAYVEATGNGSYVVHVVEKQAMQQNVVADASTLATGIRETGKIAVYGINFDTDKSEIKPGSEATLKEIAKMLQAEPKLKLFVVGHTDNAGGFEHNVKLSNDRAAAVVKALVGTHKIAASRLQPFGAGPVAPVASNRSEDGRAKNRRVELVAQ